jgi:hypothetical protein
LVDEDLKEQMEEEYRAKLTAEVKKWQDAKRAKIYKRGNFVKLNKSLSSLGGA